MIDPAMCRPGRLDKLLYVDLPNSEERTDIFRALARKLPIVDDVELRQRILESVRDPRFDGFSGADLAALVREAGVIALRRTIAIWDAPNVYTNTSINTTSSSGDQAEPKVIVGLEDFEFASRKVGPSVSTAQRRKYESLRTKFSGAVPTVKIPEEGNTT
jgi:ribosome biogenesis ATPase